MKKINFLICVALIFANANLFSQNNITSSNKITGELLKQMQTLQATQKISCVVQMKNALPFESTKSSSVKEKIEIYRKAAEESQKKILEYLHQMPEGKAEIQQKYWIINGFHLMATADVISDIVQREDVKVISEDVIVSLPPNETAVADATKTIKSRAVEWNITKVKADQCWDAGYTGKGVIIGILDTGVDYTHPALVGKWTGYWHVSQGFSQSPTPYDDNNHGTHCCGIILGGDGRGTFAEDIGVAPDARFVPVKILSGSGWGTGTQILEGMQYIADLKATVDVKAISNSWYSSHEAIYFFDAAKAITDIGILSIYCNGNTGPGTETVGSPADYPNTIGVGNTDNTDDINSSSSRGPAPSNPPYNTTSYWLRGDWSYIKPNISAPGTDINSAKPGGTYWQMTGTSMATPHVCGAAAVLFQKNYNLTQQQVYTLLIDNSDHPAQGAPYPNNNYGWGRLNVYNSLQATTPGGSGGPHIAIASQNIDNVTAGQTGNLTLSVINLGGTGSNTTVKFISNDNYIKVNSGSQNFGTLTNNQTANNNSTPFSFTAHALTPAYHQASLSVILHADGSPNYNDTITFSIIIGTMPSPVPFYSDDFEYIGTDSFPLLWTTNKYWSRINSKSHSTSHCSYSGAVFEGNSYLTFANGVDLSKYMAIAIDFWHSYDIGFSGNAGNLHVEISEDGGTNWADLWSDDLLTNLQIPWTHITTPTINSQSKNFKMRFDLNIVNATGVTKTDWWVDDIVISAVKNNEPPYFTNTTVWPDTIFTGPFPVNSDITDGNGVKTTSFHYRVNGGGWNQIALPKLTGKTYQATIPAQNLNDIIDYYLWAEDSVNPANAGTAPIGAIQATEYYTFKIWNPLNVSTYNPINNISVYPNPATSEITINVNISQKSDLNIDVYDITGRKIETVVNKNNVSGNQIVKFNNDKHLEPGVYYFKIICKGSENNVYEMIKKVVVL
ncbi:MAG: S8 family serine peptidase [Bacteroidales bacterium]|nr:S8 family serine peptidase [Bacteroidales bacterium]